MKGTAMEMTKADKAEHERWEAESDMRTLIEAERIKSDKKRLTRAKNAAREQRAALDKVRKA